MGRNVWLFAISMGCLGLLVGVLVAWSASPIATTLLSLLFGLLGGVAGFSAFKLDPSNEQEAKKIGFLGISLFGFSFCCILAIVLGSLTSGLFTSANKRNEINFVSEEDPNVFIKNFVLIKKLEMAGASDKEIATLLFLISRRYNDDNIYKQKLLILKNRSDEFLRQWEKIPSEKKLKYFTYLEDKIRIFLEEVEKLGTAPEWKKDDIVRLLKVNDVASVGWYELSSKRAVVFLAENIEFAHAFETLKHAAFYASSLPFELDTIGLDDTIRLRRMPSSPSQPDLSNRTPATRAVVPAPPSAGPDAFSSE